MFNLIEVVISSSIVLIIFFALFAGLNKFPRTILSLALISIIGYRFQEFIWPNNHISIRLIHPIITFIFIVSSIMLTFYAIKVDIDVNH